jgi:hypothetical protein
MFLIFLFNCDHTAPLTTFLLVDDLILSPIPGKDLMRFRTPARVQSPQFFPNFFYTIFVNRKCQKGKEGKTGRKGKRGRGRFD